MVAAPVLAAAPVDDQEVPVPAVAVAAVVEVPAVALAPALEVVSLHRIEEDQVQVDPEYPLHMAAEDITPAEPEHPTQQVEPPH